MTRQKAFNASLLYARIVMRALQTCMIRLRQQLTFCGLCFVDEPHTSAYFRFLRMPCSTDKVYFMACCAVLAALEHLCQVAAVQWNRCRKAARLVDAVAEVLHGGLVARDDDRLVVVRHLPLQV